MAGHGKHPFCDSNPGIQFAGRGRGNGIETFIFPSKGKGKGKNSKTGNQNTNSNGSGSGTGQKKYKCTLCAGPHRNLVWCPKLPQYLPYGNNHKEAPSSLCTKCMGTE